MAEIFHRIKVCNSRVPTIVSMDTGHMDIHKNQHRCIPVRAVTESLLILCCVTTTSRIFMPCIQLHQIGSSFIS